MPVRVTVLRADGAIATETLDPDVVDKAMALPEDPWRYFTPAADAELVSVGDLVQTRARPEGIGRAVDLMRDAHAGIVARRAPISLQRRADGRILVLDGNSTVSVAVAAGWRTIPGRFVTG